MNNSDSSAGSTQGKNSFTDKSADKNNHNKVMVFKTIDVVNEVINKYLPNWEELILKNCSLINKMKGQSFVVSNTFHVNPFILNRYRVKELNSITFKLNTVFPANEKIMFNKFLDKTQFHSNRSNPNAKPTLNISDYTICQLDDDIIVFHLDLCHGLGITINSIFKSEKLSRNLNHIVKVPYTIALSEEEKEDALIEKYQNSKEYEEKSLKEAENQADFEAEQNNNEAVSHPDYPQDYK